MFKIGDKLICKNDDELSFSSLKCGHTYTIDYIDKSYSVFSFIGDNCMYYIISYEKYFYTEKELRKQKLKRLCLR